MVLNANAATGGAGVASGVGLGTGVGVARLVGDGDPEALGGRLAASLGVADAAPDSVGIRLADASTALGPAESSGPLVRAHTVNPTPNEPMATRVMRSHLGARMEALS